jgi:hypothetical protein
MRTAVALLAALLAAPAGCGPAAAPAGPALPAIEVGDDVKAAGLELKWWELASERSARVTIKATKRTLTTRPAKGGVKLKATAYGLDGDASPCRAWFDYRDVRPGELGRATLNVSGEGGFAAVGRVVVGLE